MKEEKHRKNMIETEKLLREADVLIAEVKCYHDELKETFDQQQESAIMSEEGAKAIAVEPTEDTVFGRILRKEIPCDFIYEDEKVSILRYHSSIFKSKCRTF